MATNLFGVVTDRAGETGAAGGAPTWLATLNTGYSNGPFMATLTTRYIRGGDLGALNIPPDDPRYRITVASNGLTSTATPNSITDNGIGGTVYFNLNSSWDLGGKFGTQLFVQVNNLLDRSPPNAPQLQFPSNPVYYDLVGRSYRFGVRMKL